MEGVMSGEQKQTEKPVVCRSDERIGLYRVTGQDGNQNVSMFVRQAVRET